MTSATTKPVDYNKNIQLTFILFIFSLLACGALLYFQVTIQGFQDLFMLTTSSLLGKFFWGATIGLLITWDLGTVINKLAFCFGVILIPINPLFMGAVAASVSVPPVALFLASLILKVRGKKIPSNLSMSFAGLLGAIGFTEAAIPYIKSRKNKTFIYIVRMGGALSGVTSMLLGVEVNAFFGGFFVPALRLLPGRSDAVNKLGPYFFAIFTGIFASALVIAIIWSQETTFSTTDDLDTLATSFIKDKTDRTLLAASLTCLIFSILISLLTSIEATIAENSLFKDKPLVYLIHYYFNLGVGNQEIITVKNPIILSYLFFLASLLFMFYRVYLNILKDCILQLYAFMADANVFAHNQLSEAPKQSRMQTIKFVFSVYSNRWLAFFQPTTPPKSPVNTARLAITYAGLGIAFQAFIFGDYKTALVAGPIGLITFISIQFDKHTPQQKAETEKIYESKIKAYVTFVTVLFQALSIAAKLISHYL